MLVDVSWVIGILILAEASAALAVSVGLIFTSKPASAPRWRVAMPVDDVVRERSSAIIIEAHRAGVICDVRVEGRHTSAQPGKAYEVGGFCREDLLALGILDIAIACTRRDEEILEGGCLLEVCYVRLQVVVPIELVGSTSLHPEVVELHAVRQPIGVVGEEPALLMPFALHPPCGYKRYPYRHRGA